MGGGRGPRCRKTHDEFHSRPQGASERRLHKVSWCWAKSAEKPHVERCKGLRQKQDHNPTKTKRLLPGFTEKQEKAQKISRATAEYCTLLTAVDLIWCCFLQHSLLIDLSLPILSPLRFPVKSNKVIIFLIRIYFLSSMQWDSLQVENKSVHGITMTPMQVVEQKCFINKKMKKQQAPAKRADLSNPVRKVIMVTFNILPVYSFLFAFGLDCLHHNNGTVTQTYNKLIKIQESN